MLSHKSIGSQMLDEKERECLSQLTQNPIWASSAWQLEGLTDMFRDLQARGFVGCRDRDGQSADPLDIDDGVYWFITDQGRAAFSAQN
jgi:hypothetical protein